MALELKKLERLVMGLTQQDQMFRDALEELSGTPVNFYDNKQRAYTRLNHALVGTEADLMYPVTIAGEVDFNQNTLSTIYNGEEFTYNLDEMDPEYVRTMNQVATNQGLRANKNSVQLTSMAMELLDEIHADKEQKPEVPEVEERKMALSNTPRRNLQKAFENEMLFNVQLQEFIDENGLGTLFDAHSDEMTEFIGEKRFQASFNDGLQRIDQELSAHIESKGMMER